MAHQSNLIAEDIHAYLKQQERKSLLRFITCGSVDDGKSTLIGRLLWDSKMIFEDQLAALEKDSKKVGTQGDKIDYALLLDGLQAEREQGITIDVAYRFFSTDKRKFIVADTPGHEQYTRNMVTGASTAQVAIILVDARKGILTQTRRHSYLTSLVGIRHIVLAINKMDLVDYSQKTFEAIRKDYTQFTTDLGFESITAIPISALEGDNILQASNKTEWYQGPTLMNYLETVKVDDTSSTQPFRMRVQWVNRPHLDFRGFSGSISSGSISPGEHVTVCSSGKTSKIAKIVTMDGELPQAVAGQAVTLCLTDEIDISRGDLLAGTESKPYYIDRFKAKLVWLHEGALLPGRKYLLKAGSTTTPAQIDCVNYKVNINNLQHEPGKTLELNEVGGCTVSTDIAIPFDSYRTNRDTGSFIIIDRFSNATIGAGMIDNALKRDTENHWKTININKQAHAALKRQTPKVLWFTGLSGEENSTVANLLEKKLHSLGKHTYILDGDELRQHLNRDLGDTDSDRVEHVRRIAEIANILVAAGIIVIVPLTSPFRNQRCMAREVFDQDEFVEIHLDTPLELCEQRDRASAYEVPEAPEYQFDSSKTTLEEIAVNLADELFNNHPIEWEI